MKYCVLLVALKIYCSNCCYCFSCMSFLLFSLGLSHWKRFWLVCTARSAI